MPDDLYDRDALTWSEQQADLLRRLARGERVNDVDWEHVVEEIEDVGRSELHAVESYLDLMMLHLLKLSGWPDLSAGGHWRAEVIAFQARAKRQFTASMRQRIDLPAIYRSASHQIQVLRLAGHPPRATPANCPVTLEQLLTASLDELLATFAASAGG